MRRLLPLLAAAALAACSGAQRAGSGRIPEAGAVVRTARSQLGARYRFGGKSPKEGFDCSGLVLWVFGRHGLPLPRRSSDQFRQGRKVGPAGLKPGDLVFFDIDGRGPSHVGIYSGKGLFIHAPSKGSKAVREDAISEAYWRGRFLGGRRLL